MTSLRTAARFAFIAVVLFAAHFLTYFVPALRDATFASAPALAVGVAVLALAQHGVVFPVVSALPAPSWARNAAYVWLIGDMISDLMQLGGSPIGQYLTLRLFVNVLAALWIIAASWRAPMAMRIIGIFIAWDLVAYSLTAPFNSGAFVISLPSLVLVPVWFALVGRLLTQMAAQAPITNGQPAAATPDSSGANAG
jgi:hypothetical protein